MGDRCLVVLFCRKQDRDKFLPFMGWPNNFEQEEETSGMLEIHDSQANDAHYDELKKLAEEGIVFYGQNYQGDTYGPGVWVSFGKEFVDCDSIQGSPAVIVREDGQPDKHQLEMARKYHQLEKKAITFIKGHITETETKDHENRTQI